MKRLTTLLLLLTIAVVAVAQTGATVRGFVYQEETGEPIIFTNVFLKGTTMGSSTDVNGFYQINQVPAGSYQLTVTFLGNDSLSVPITVSEGEVITEKLYMKQGAIQMGVVTISAEKQEAQNQVKISVEKITPKDIKSMPSTGGEADLAQYLQVLPGVVFTGDQGGQLYIRGGSPVQNKVLLDGMIVYNAFHSIGLFSVFDTDILRNADVYSGGFNAEYGGRVSSVMDITTRDGNKRRLAGKISGSTFGTKLLLEGPLKKQTKDGGGSSSFVLSAKRAIIEQTAPVLYPQVNDGEGLPFDFTDLYGKISFNGTNGSKFNLFGFRFQDDVRYQAISDLNWRTYGVGTNFVVIPGISPTLIEGNFAFSDYKISLQESNLSPRSSRVNSFNLGLNFKYFMGDNEFKYGFEVLGFRTEFQFFNSVGLRFDQIENTTEIAGFMSYKLKANRLVLEPSLRMHYYASLNDLSFEPRIGAKYNVTDNFRLKGAAGIYSQNLIAANSDRDVVNLFYGFLSGPENLQDQFVEQDGTVRDLTHRLQKANHYILGTEWDLNKYFNLNIEGYIKDFTQLINTNRNKVFEDAQNPEVRDELKKDFIVETGVSQGVDVVAKYNKPSYSLWAVWSVLESTRFDGISEYVPVFDRRHNVNLVGNYYFGKNRSWEASVRWNYGSALPFTPNAGFGQYLAFAGGGDEEFLNENPETLYTILGDINSQRLVDYHRLDLGLKKFFELSKYSRLELNAGVTNVYDRENVFYVDRVTQEIVRQLPILPSLGASLTF